MIEHNDVTYNPNGYPTGAGRRLNVNMGQIHLANIDKVRKRQEANMSALEKIVLPTYDEQRQHFINKRVNDILVLIRDELTKEDPTDIFDAKSRRPTIRLEIPYDVNACADVKEKLTEALAEFGWTYRVDPIDGNIAFWHLRMYIYLADQIESD